MAPLVASWDQIEECVLGPMQVPHHPLALLRFALRALRSARGLAECVFTGEHARGFFAGLAAHAMMPLERVPSAAFGLILGILGHVVGWPLPRGGAQHISDALASYLRMSAARSSPECPLPPWTSCRQPVPWFAISHPGSFYRLQAIVFQRGIDGSSSATGTDLQPSR